MQEYTVEYQDCRIASNLAFCRRTIKPVIKPTGLDNVCATSKRLDEASHHFLVVERVEEISQRIRFPATVASFSLIVKSVHTCPNCLPSKVFNQRFQPVAKRGLPSPIDTINRYDCAMRKASGNSSDFLQHKNHSPLSPLNDIGLCTSCK